MQIEQTPNEMNPNHPNPQLNPPQLNSIRPPNQNPPPDLPNTLTSLKALTQFCQSTLHSLSSLTFPNNNPSSLTQCPSNPHHWVPPKSLFHHHLDCPSKVGHLLGPTQTVESDNHFAQERQFVELGGDTSNDLCFPLYDYVGCETGFFYRDCPGVVCLSDDDVSQRRVKVFSLPKVLAVECGNFVACGGEGGGFMGNCVRMLVSEIWVVEREVERWGDSPEEYSCSVLKAVLSVGVVRVCDLVMWVVVNSPRFGVVVDEAVGEHVVALVRLCVRAMVREAGCSYEGFRRNVDENGGRVDLKSLRFRCPVLVEVMRWLVMQLSILYGEAGAKGFGVAMVKYLLPKAASHASLFAHDMKMDQTSTSGEDKDSGRDCRGDEKLLSRGVFVYQIGAAIAALHERSLLEAKIRALRMPVPLPAYQRVNEHAYLSKKADEERQNRPDYRPIIDHDSLPSQRKYEDNNKTKTREELLAEERDYKRRRMSYRGKKLKRSTKEVMRDIIEKYMEAITQSGGIGCVAKVDEGSTSVPKTSAFDSTNLESSHMVSSDQRDGYRKTPQRDHTFGDRKHVNASPSRYDQPEKEFYSHRHSESQKTSIYRHGRDSRSPGKERGHIRSREHRSHRSHHDAMRTDEDKHSRSRHSNSSRHHDHKKTSTSNSVSSSSGCREKRKRESRDRHRWERREETSPDFSGQADFNDRYDPSEACDIYDDQFEDSEYTRPHS